MAKRKIGLPVTPTRLDLTDKRQGFLAVLIGIFVALVLGYLATSFGWPITWLYWLLAIGVIVGILNIFHKEAILFLISGLTITFMLNVLTSSTLFPAWLVTMLNALVYLLASASVVVGLKVLYALATK